MSHFSSSFCFVYSLFYTKNNNDEQPLHCEALLEFDNNVNINDDEEEGDNNSLGDSSNEGIVAIRGIVVMRIVMKNVIVGVMILV